LIDISSNLSTRGVDFVNLCEFDMGFAVVNSPMRLEPFDLSDGAFSRREFFRSNRMRKAIRFEADTKGPL
jgi:hypothetical protein